MATAAVAQPQHAFNTIGKLPETFRVNAGSLPQTKLGWLRSSPADLPIAELRKRLEQDQYVFVKGLIPREDVLAMREHYFSQYEGTGLLKPDAPYVDGIYNSEDDAALHRGIGGGDPEGKDLGRLIEAHKTPRYQHFVHHPKLRKMVRDLMGWDEEIMLQRSMLRHNVPSSPGEKAKGQATGVHYDKLFLRGGDAFFLTAWVPIGDIRPTGGGLFYLEDSVKLGQAIEDDFNSRADSADFPLEEKISAFNVNMTRIGILSDHPSAFEQEHSHIAQRAGLANPQTYRWLVSNYEAGDVVFHHPCAVHSSCSNEDPDGRIRLSTDLRFYDKKEYDEGNADERWMKFWTPGDGL